MPLFLRPYVCFSLVLLAIMVAEGCGRGPCVSPSGAVGDDLRAVVLSGFEEPPSRLFVSRGRLCKLIEALGYSARRYTRRVVHSSDGTSIWCMDAGGDTILISKDQEPKIVKKHPYAELNDRGDATVWGTDGNDPIYIFRDGTRMLAPGLSVDGKGRFFGYGGQYYDYAQKVLRVIPIRIALLDAPEKPLAVSEMKGVFGGLFATDDRIYIFVRHRDYIVCEEWAVEGPTLRKERRFDIRPPAWFAVGFVAVRDFDPESGELLLKVGRDLPLLGGPIWYVYEMKTGKFRKIGVFEGYVGFLDRQVFDAALGTLREEQ